MLISFYHFQWMLATLMVLGLIVLLLPAVRLIKEARLPAIAVTLILIPSLMWRGCSGWHSTGFPRSCDDDVYNVETVDKQP
jgi:hypothetical protein